MRITVALINNDEVPPTNLQRFVESRGCDHRTLDHRSLAPTEDLAEFDGAILSGTGERTWLAPSPYSDEMAMIRRATIPLLGICGGHQILAQAYGSSLAPLDAAVYGRTRLMRCGPSELFAHLPDELVVFSKHRYGVAELAKEFRVTARNTASCIYAIEHVQELKFGVQFHPERRNDGTQILDNFIALARRQRQARSE